MLVVDADRLSYRISVRLYRRVWSVRRGARREPAGEVSVRARGLREDAVPRAADALRQAAAAAAVATDRLGAGHRADVLRPSRRQDADRDAHPGHAAQRRLVQLAVHARHPVTSPPRRAPAERPLRRRRRQGRHLGDSVIFRSPQTGRAVRAVCEVVVPRDVL